CACTRQPGDATRTILPWIGRLCGDSADDALRRACLGCGCARPARRLCHAHRESRPVRTLRHNAAILIFERCYTSDPSLLSCILQPQASKAACIIACIEQGETACHDPFAVCR